MLFNSDALAALKKINKPFKGMDPLLLTLSVSILQNNAIVVNTFFSYDCNCTSFSSGFVLHLRLVS